MIKLENYLQDGANYQARATLMYLQADAEIEESWNKCYEKYDAKIKVGRWENCREQGYVVSLKNKEKKQLNIAFFGHRNSDEIHAIKWQQESLNILNFDSAEFGGIYKDKYDTSHFVNYGEAKKMADWIIKELSEHWGNK